MRLFLAGFLTLIAAGMAQATRSDILNLWGQDFGFTQSELGNIAGMGLMGFGLSIIFFSFFADLFGYGALMVFAFLLHFAAMVTTLAAPFAFKSDAGKEGAYWCLYVGQFLFSLANGTCEAVINPLTATLFPRNKTHWLNILHAGWPGGLVLGAILGLIFNLFPAVGWPVRWAIVLAPIVLYGLLMVGRRFPRSETRTHGVGARQMMGQLGMLGAFVAVLLLGLFFSKDLLPGMGLPGWPGWLIALGLWLAFGWITNFSLGHWMLAFLFVMHALIGWVELGTDSWIVNIGKIVLNPNLSLLAFIWTNLLMFGLRFFAGPIVHKISPIGLLFGSAVIGTAGLLLLGLPAVDTALLWFAAVTVYGIGKTFYWPTMLGVISERFPRGGAIALGFSGGVGMLSAGILGGPLIGYQQDFSAVRALKALPSGKETYERYRAPEPTSPLPLLPDVAGLDNAKIKVLQDYMAIQEKVRQAVQDKKTVEAIQMPVPLEQDVALLEFQNRPVPSELAKRLKWWQSEGRPHADQDFPRIKEVQLIGGKTALTWTAAIPAAMALGFLLLIVYFRAVGGYKAEVLIGHKAVDEEFTGGTEGPGEG
jgi:MFS family permease